MRGGMAHRERKQIGCCRIAAMNSPIAERLLGNSRVAGDLRDRTIRKVGRGEVVEDGIDLVVIIDAVWPFHDPLKPGDLAHPWQVAEPSLGKTGIAMIAIF